MNAITLKFVVDHRRTGQAVRGGSRYAEDVAASPLNRADRRLRMRAFDWAAKRLRARGKVRTLLTWTDKAVLAHLMELACRFRGRVFPTYAGIARAVGCGARTVARAIKRLKAEGWIDWTRRCRPTGNAGLRGPQVEQISNAYRFKLPSAAEQLLGLWKKADTPRWRDEEGEANAEARRRMVFDDSELGAAFDRLDRALRTRMTARP